MLNHVPVIGAPLLLLLLSIGLLRRSRELVTVSLVLVVGLAVATGLVYLTGEPAEELVERAPWFRETLVETHEEHARIGLVAVLVTGVLAGAALALSRRPKPAVWLPRLAWAGLALSTVLLGWTGWSGGQIRHEEVRSAAPVPFGRDPLAPLVSRSFIPAHIANHLAYCWGDGNTGQLGTGSYIQGARDRRHVV